MKKTLLAFIAIFLSLQMTMAQRQITGSVKSTDNNELLIGSSIVVTGTRVGTITNGDGKFSISVPESAKSLTISFVGYETKEVTLTNANNYEIKLGLGKELSEVVVVGYTSQRKEDLTGSVAVVEMKPIKNNSSNEKYRLWLNHTKFQSSELAELVNALLFNLAVTLSIVMFVTQALLHESI